MSVISDAAVSRGDLSKRLDALEARLDTLFTARRAEATAVGRNGVRVHSGGSVALEGGGSLLVDDGGDVRVVGGQIVIQDPSGTETFLAGTDGLTLTGLLQVLGGGDISVTDGRLVASDEDGEVFAVDPTVPRIAMRKELISALAREIIAETHHFDSRSGSVNTASATYDPLSDGPVVAGVEVSEAGLALVGVQANIPITNSETVNRIGSMSYSVSGATTRAAIDDNAYRVGSLHNNLDNIDSINVRAMAWSAQTGLTAGAHTFTAEYRAQVDSLAIGFAERRLLVIAF